MIHDALNALRLLLNASESSFDQVAYYEGQFEDFKEFSINPPAVFIELEAGENQNVNLVRDEWSVRLIIVTSHLRARVGGNYSSMFSIIETLQSELHKTALTDADGAYIGRCMYKRFSRDQIYPGFNIYSMYIDIVR